MMKIRALMMMMMMMMMTVASLPLVPGPIVPEVLLQQIIQELHYHPTEALPLEDQILLQQVTVVLAVDQKEDIWNKDIAIQEHHYYLTVEI
jgi:hypothetical protein